MNYIKRFHNTQALSVLVLNIYSKDQLMHTIYLEVATLGRSDGGHF